MNNFPATTVPVTTFPEGQQIRIHRIGVTGREARRLHDQGLREGCEACVRSQAGTCVLDLDASVCPLQHEIAEQILAPRAGSGAAVYACAGPARNPAAL